MALWLRTVFCSGKDFSGFSREWVGGQICLCVALGTVPEPLRDTPGNPAKNAFMRFLVYWFCPALIPPAPLKLCIFPALGR